MPGTPRLFLFLPLYLFKAPQQQVLGVTNGKLVAGFRVFWVNYGHPKTS